MERRRLVEVVEIEGILAGAKLARGWAWRRRYGQVDYCRSQPCLRFEAMAAVDAADKM